MATDLTASRRADPQGAKACTHWIGAASRRCDASPTRPYIVGPRCSAHTPAVLAGKPEPGQRAYCPPKICWCGGCPWWKPASTYPAHAVSLKPGGLVDAAGGGQR